MALSFWRWSLALLILLQFAWPHLRRDLPILKKSWLSLVTLGVLGIGVFNTLLYTGLQSTTAVNGLLLQSLQPGVILMLGAVLFSEKVRFFQFAGIVLAAMGAVEIVSRGDPGSLLLLDLNEGDLTIGCAVLVWSLYSVFLRKRPSVHPLSFLAATMAVGVVSVTPFYVMEIASGQLIVARPESWMAVAYVCVFPSLIAYLCFNRGVELLGSATAGLYMNIMPILGSALAALFLGEAIRQFHIVGGILIGAGIFLASIRKAAPKSNLFASSDS